MQLQETMQGVIFSSSDIETGKTYHLYTGVDFEGTFDENGFATEGSFSNGTEVGSVEVTDTVSQIGSGSVSNFSFGGGGGGGRH
jgi:hypothetical protein